MTHSAPRPAGTGRSRRTFITPERRTTAGPFGAQKGPSRPAIRPVLDDHDDTPVVDGAKNDDAFPDASPGRSSRWRYVLLTLVATVAAYRIVVGAVGIAVSLAFFYLAGSLAYHLLVRRRRMKAGPARTATVVFGAVLSGYLALNAFAGYPWVDDMIDGFYAARYPTAAYRVTALRGKERVTLSASARRVGVDEANAGILRDAVLSIEDRRFASRFGYLVLDPISMPRAAFNSAFYEKQGGSGIEVQTSKNITGEQGSSELVDKPVQAFIALRLTQRFTAGECFARYLDAVTLSDRPGMAALAWNLFRVDDLRRLSLPQAALLAAMLKSPKNYAPRSDDPEVQRNTLGRRNEVLRLMCDQGVISETERAAAEREPIRVVARADVRRLGSLGAAALRFHPEIAHGLMREMND